MYMQLPKTTVRDKRAYHCFFHSLLLCLKHPSIEMSTSQSQPLYLYNCVGNLIWKQVNQSPFFTIRKSKVIP